LKKFVILDSNRKCAVNGPGMLSISPREEVWTHYWSVCAKQWKWCVCIDFAPASTLIFEQLVCHGRTFIFSLILLLLI